MNRKLITRFVLEYYQDNVFTLQQVCRTKQLTFYYHEISVIESRYFKCIKIWLYNNIIIWQKLQFCRWLLLRFRKIHILFEWLLQSRAKTKWNQDVFNFYHIAFCLTIYRHVQIYITNVTARLQQSVYITAGQLSNIQICQVKNQYHLPLHWNRNDLHLSNYERVHLPRIKRALLVKIHVKDILLPPEHRCHRLLQNIVEYKGVVVFD